MLQQLFTINDPVLQRALTEPANLGYIKNVLGLSEMVIPGEDSRNKQLREIQQLLASAPIVVNLPLAPNSSSVIPGEARTASSPRGFGAENPSSSIVDGTSGESKRDSSSPSAPRNDGEGVSSSPSDHQSPSTNHGTQSTEHGTRTLVLPSVPVDQLLDDHAVEFEECKRWANSEAGQSARMTNPAGFANVRAHAEAHLRAMAAMSRGTSGG